MSRQVVAFRSSRHVAIANRVWRLSLIRDALAFRRATHAVAKTQTSLLMRLIRHNCTSEFGQRWKFDSLSSVEDYRTQVPLSRYEDFENYIDRIAHGVPGVLTSDPVILLEPTSGSTGPTKYIPYTRSLQAEFRRAIAPWIVGMFHQNSDLLRGQAYWSISPVVRHDRYNAAAIPIGFEDDSEYLGGLARKLAQVVMAVPSCVRLIDDVDSFRYITLLLLLRSRSLSIISIWHPTFLTLLLQPLHEWLGNLTHDIATGRMTPPNAIPEDAERELRAAMHPDPHRAFEIKKCFGGASDFGEVSPRLWPRLGLVSCWSDGNAEAHVPALRSLFPNAVFQAKGLVATEGIVSIPIGQQSACALAVRSHFFEFLPYGAETTDDTVLAHELEQGARYSVVITTAGGLYRYLTSDLVDIIGTHNSCPILRFVGKESHISDRFGEKLNEMHVQEALDSILSTGDVSLSFAMLAFDDAGSFPAYSLFVESHLATDSTLRSLGSCLDSALRENFHYDYCRDLGQLRPLRVFRIERDAYLTYARVCQDGGQRIGDLKPSVLHTRNGWSEAFVGRFLA